MSSPRKRPNDSEIDVGGQKKLKVEDEKPDLNQEDSDVDEPVWCLKKAQSEKPSRQCPYLDTINR